MDKGRLGKGKRTSIKKSFYCYIFVMSVVVVALSAAAVKVCTDMRDKILLSHAYTLEPDPDLAEPEPGGPYVIPPTITKKDGVNESQGNTQKNDLPEFSDREKFFCHVLEVLVVVLPFLFICIGIWISGSLFYFLKLKKPFYLLEQGISHIKQGDLDFSLEYSRQDELGQLCGAFETMRQEIVKNNTEMWNMVDERKKLNASVAHDLRTPITVIKGYSEYLRLNLARNNLSPEDRKEILSYIENAAGRLEAYAESVHHIHKLENLDLEYRNVDLPAFSEEISSALKVMADEAGRQINVSARLPNQRISLSTVAVFRILENLVQNACDYSRKNIFVELGLNQDYFTITVIDDGDGFQNIEKCSDASTNGEIGVLFSRQGNCPENSSTHGKRNHYGMGLAICNILSEKHGGNLFLSNDSDMGAKVFVKLKIRDGQNG